MKNKLMIVAAFATLALPVMAQQKEVRGLDLNVLANQVKELQRKMSGRDGKGGIQKEVTILHAQQGATEAKIRQMDEETAAELDSLSKAVKALQSKTELKRL